MARITRLRRSWYLSALVPVTALGMATAVTYEGSAVSFRPGENVAGWPTADGVRGNHYSTLSDITPDNVSHLELAWSYRTGDVHAHEGGRSGTAFEATPILADGALYVSTPYGRAVALDAETGVELWTFDPEIDRTDTYQTMVTSRGLSHWVDSSRSPDEECASRIVLASPDARLFSLDARTGEPCRDFGAGGSIDTGADIDRIQGRRHQFKQTAPPAIVGDLVVVGSSIFDSHFADAPSGSVHAYDARTGELVWSWEPLLGVGGVLGNGKRVPAGAANTWATITADAERDLVFVPTGSPSPDHYGGLRPGDNDYGNSLVALRASTGEVVWHAQLVHHDLWDYDLPSPPALVTLQKDGRSIPAVVQSTKQGYLFAFDRETGEPIFPIEEVPVPASDVPGEVASPTQPIPVLPRPLAPQGLRPEDAWGLTPVDRAACRRQIASHRRDGVFAPPSLKGTIVYPGFIGGMEWGGVAFDPVSGLLVTNTNRVAMVATLIPREVADRAPPPADDAKFSIGEQEGTPYAVKREPLLSPLGIPCSPPPWGMLHAVDMRTGELAWEVPLGRVTDLAKVPTPMRWGSPNLGGPLVAGGLVFIAATMDRRLRAFDLSDGEVVWTAKLPASAQSSPMTYRARPGGRQFVVIAAGGHDGMRSSLGDYILAYALPAPHDLEVAR